MESFQVGEFTVEADLNRILRGDETHQLEPRMIEVLVYLAQRPGEVVSRDQLIEELWPQTFVSDKALTYAVGGLRKALGDDSRQPQYIETIQKRGYRLIAEVQGSPRGDNLPEAPSARKRSGLPWLGGGAVAVVAAITFFNAGGTPDGGVAPITLFAKEPTMYRMGTQGRTSVLAVGATLEPGDELFLELQSAVSLYVYVLNEDEAGASFVLFPNPDYEVQNPVPSGELVRLPGRVDGSDFVWQVSSAGGTEHFLVVAARHRLIQLEERIAELSELELDTADPDRTDVPRGTGRAVAATTEMRSSSSFSSLAPMLAEFSREGSASVYRFEFKGQHN